jgi:predicted N-acetyltransferase YhbS
MESHIVIEPATSDDAEAILHVQQLAFQSEAAIYNDDTIPPLTQTLAELHSEFERKVFLKACMHGTIIASVRAEMQQETCCIGRLIVHPDVQGRGIGTRLMHAIEQCFTNASRFEIFTGQKSARNIYLYRKLGYNTFRSETVSRDLTIVFMEKQNCT